MLNCWLCLTDWDATWHKHMEWVGDTFETISVPVAASLHGINGTERKRYKKENNISGSSLDEMWVLALILSY